MLGPVPRILRAVMLSLFVRQSLRAFVAAASHEEEHARAKIVITV